MNGRGGALNDESYKKIHLDPIPFLQKETNIFVIRSDKQSIYKRSLKSEQFFGAVKHVSLGVGVLWRGVSFIFFFLSGL